MEFRVLGPFEVWRDGGSVDIRGTKRKAVLALLVLRANEVVRSERLIDELWGDERPANAAAALYNHVSRLRKDLGDEVLVTKPWGYVLRADRESIDVHRFTGLVAEAAPLPAKERAAKLREALALWRGPALADLASEPALTFEADRLEDLRLAALEQRIEADLELGGHAGLIAELEALIAEEPLRERLRGQLIVALYRSGRQAEALEVYRETRRVLVEELGIEPSPALRELEQAILRQDIALTPPAAPAGFGSRARSVPRAVLLVLAFGSLLAAGTAAAVVVATHRSHPSGATKAASGPALTEAVGRSSESTRTACVVRTHTASQHTRTTTTPTTAAHTRTTTTTATQKQTRHRVVQTTPVAPTTRPAPVTTTVRATASKWVWSLADDFADPAFTGRMWNLELSGTGVEPLEQSGQLEFLIAQDATVDGDTSVDGRYRARCTMLDDFDAQVDFQLVDWPAANGVNIRLGAVVGGDLWTASRVGARADGALEGYAGDVRSSHGRTQTEDVSGSLRVARTHDVLSTYYRGKLGWVQLASGRDPRFADLVLYVDAANDGFGHHSTRVAFDNFRATAEHMFCPGPFYAARKRITP
jgi:DNA-binding SARP family transcriptional activator